MKFPAHAPVGAAKLADLQARLARLGLDLERVEETAVRSRGPGGQKANKTSSGVMLRYDLAGAKIVVRWTRERDHALNRFLALRELAAEVEAVVSPSTSPRRREHDRIRKAKARARRRGAARGEGPGAPPAGTSLP